MYLIPGVVKEDYSDYVLYFVENLSDELKQEIRNTPFTQLGKKYNVSDKCIVKWCEYYKLPTKKSIIKTYSDDDWELI